MEWCATYNHVLTEDQIYPPNGSSCMCKFEASKGIILQDDLATLFMLQFSDIICKVRAL
jgi:hypothetical protein